MEHSVLIADTTPRQRKSIVMGILAENRCDPCVGCGMCLGLLDSVYKPYLDGEMELEEINKRTGTGSFYQR